MDQENLDEMAKNNPNLGNELEALDPNPLSSHLHQYFTSEPRGHDFIRCCIYVQFQSLIAMYSTRVTNIDIEVNALTALFESQPVFLLMYSTLLLVVVRPRVGLIGVRNAINALFLDCDGRRTTTLVPFSGKDLVVM